MNRVIIIVLLSPIAMILSDNCLVRLSSSPWHGHH